MSGLKATLALVAVLVALPGAAFAHGGGALGHGFVHGFAHPFGGLDHVLAMVAVGLFAAHLGGRALWLVPLSFLTMMALGGALGLAGFPLPYGEIAIALSVIVLGLAVALRIGAPTLAAMALVGFFAIFHGFAHGSEMSAAGSPYAYALGFIAATALLHALGIAFGLLIGRIGEAPARRLVRAVGGALTLAGVAIFAGLV
jgi:urease accessory protein